MLQETVGQYLSKAFLPQHFEIALTPLQRLCSCASPLDRTTSRPRGSTPLQQLSYRPDQPLLLLSLIDVVKCLCWACRHSACCCWSTEDSVGAGVLQQLTQHQHHGCC
jgi:hypothetical protein